MTITTLNLNKVSDTNKTSEIISSLKNSKSDILVFTEFNNSNKQLKNSLEGENFTLYPVKNNNGISPVFIAYNKQASVNSLVPLNNSNKIIEITSKDFTLLGAYIPGSESNLTEKIDLFEFLICYLDKYPKNKIIITGDLNTGKKGIDNEGKDFELPYYYDKLESRLIDTWRYKHCNEPTQFSWYHPSSGNGFRLDHFFVKKSLMDLIKPDSLKCDYDHKTRQKKIGGGFLMTNHSMLTLKFDFKFNS